MKDYNKLSKDELMDELILLGDENLILTKLNNKLSKQFSLYVVSHQRELLKKLNETGVFKNTKEQIEMILNIVNY
jgi:predicted transcriptional regulator YheO